MGEEIFDDYAIRVIANKTYNGGYKCYIVDDTGPPYTGSIEIYDEGLKEMCKTILQFFEQSESEQT